MASFTVQKYQKPFNTLATVAADTQYQLIVESSNVIYTVLQVLLPHFPPGSLELIHPS